MTYLANVDHADFPELKSVLETTQGNLSVHLRKLEDAAYVEITKQFQERKPQTLVKITTQGKQALANYIEALGQLLGTIPQK